MVASAAMIENTLAQKCGRAATCVWSASSIASLMAMTIRSWPPKVFSIGAARIRSMTAVKAIRRTMPPAPPRKMPQKRCLGASSRHASAIRIALSPESRRSIQTISTTAQAKARFSFIRAVRSVPRLRLSRDGPRRQFRPGPEIAGRKEDSISDDRSRTLSAGAAAGRGKRQYSASSRALCRQLFEAIALPGGNVAATGARRPFCRQMI